MQRKTIFRDLLSIPDSSADVVGVSCSVALLQLDYSSPLRNQMSRAVLQRLKTKSSLSTSVAFLWLLAREEMMGGVARRCVHLCVAELKRRVDSRLPASHDSGPPDVVT